MPLITYTFGPTSRHLLTPRSFAPCVALNAQFETETCLEVEVSARQAAGYWLMCSTLLLFLLCGFDGAPTHRFLREQLYPPAASRPDSTGRLPSENAARRLGPVHAYLPLTINGIVDL